MWIETGDSTIDTERSPSLDMNQEMIALYAVGENKVH